MWHATATGSMVAPVRPLGRYRLRARVSASRPASRGGSEAEPSSRLVPALSRRRVWDSRGAIRVRAATQRYNPWVDPDDGPVAEDAPLRIDQPVGYSWGDELDDVRIDEDERVRAVRKWQEGSYVPDDDDDEMYEPSPDGDTLYGKGPSSKRLRWPPSLGHGTVPRIARSLWALVAVVGVVWAVWSSVKHVMFLDFTTFDFGNLSAALDAAALEALGGLAEGALVSTVVAPVVAALTAGFFELNLRFLTIMTAANLPRTLAPATAKTVADRERRIKAMKESRAQHLAYAKLKKSTFSACEARHAAAAHACAAWSRPVVAVVLGLAVWLAAVAVSGGFGALVGVEQAIYRTGAAGQSKALTTFGLAAWYVIGAALAALTACLRRRPGAYAADARKEMERREQEYLATLHKGTFLCQWRSDDYATPGERNKVNPDKALTNAVVAAAAVGAAAHRRLPPSDAAALVLDASDAKTSEKLSTAFSYFGVGGETDRANKSMGPAGRFMSWLTSPMAPVDEPVEGEYSYGTVYDSMSNSFDSLDDDSLDDGYSFEDEGTEEFEEFEGKVVQAAPYLRGSVELGRKGKGADWRYWWDNVKAKASKRVAAARGAHGAGATKADLEREALELNEGLGFPKKSVLVPNQHTHVVESLRGAGSPCTPYAADVAEVLRKRDPKAPPLNLVYLDHCGAVKQREQQLWDVFSRHSVADGGVLAVTFSTRGKRLGWSKAAAVAACARGLVEAADAHGYELEGGAADAALEPHFLDRLMDYTVHFGDSLAPSSSSEEEEDPNESAEYRQTTTTVAESDGVAAAAAALRAHRSAVDAALREYTRQCESLGGVEAAFREVVRGNPVETEANRAAALAARALANALVVWADDVPASKDGRAVSFDTWASRRRRRLCRYLHSRVAGEEWDRVSPPTREDGRLLQSLGREVVKSAGKAADLAQPAVAEGVEWRKLEGDIKGELTYPRCFFLYNSLMFFVFRVRVKRRVRKGKGEERTFEDRLKLAPR